MPGTFSPGTSWAAIMAATTFLVARAVPGVRGKGANETCPISWILAEERRAVDTAFESVAMN